MSILKSVNCVTRIIKYDIYMYFVLNFNPYCIFYYIFVIVVGKK